MAAYEGKRFKTTANGGSAARSSASAESSRAAHAAGAHSAPRHAAPAHGSHRSVPEAGRTQASSRHAVAPIPLGPASHTAHGAESSSYAGYGHTHGAYGAAQTGAAAGYSASGYHTAGYGASSNAMPAYRAADYSDDYKTHGRRGRRSGATGGDGGKPRRRSILSYILIVVGVALLLVAVGIFVWAELGYRQAAAEYENLDQYIQISDSDGSGDDVPVVDWDALAKENEDIVAWVYIPDTKINYPVLQGEDNDEYLRKLPDGTSNNSGSIMLDCDQTAPGMVDQQTTLYGHHMNDSSMFHHIEETLDQDTFDTIKVVYYLTPEKTYKLTPLFTARVPESFIDARQGNFGSTEALQKYLKELKESAQAVADDVDERLAKTEQVLSLVTCSGIAPADHRAVMVCTIADVTEAVQVDTTSE